MNFQNNWKRYNTRYLLWQTFRFDIQRTSFILVYNIIHTKKAFKMWNLVIFKFLDFSSHMSFKEVVNNYVRGGGGVKWAARNILENLGGAENIFTVHKVGGTFLYATSKMCINIIARPWNGGPWNVLTCSRGASNIFCSFKGRQCKFLPSLNISTHPSPQL